MFSVLNKMRSFTHAERVGYQLRKMRNMADMKQETVAAKAGISRSQLSQIENGKVDVSLSTLFYAVTAIGATLGQFFSEMERFFEDLG